MIDAFGNHLEVGTKVLYSVKSGRGTMYALGKIVKLIPWVLSQKSYQPPDRVEIEIDTTNDGSHKFFTKNPILYASNVVVQ